MESPIPLRPMTVGEVLDRSFRLYRNHFLPWFLAVLLVESVAFVLLQIYLGQFAVPLFQQLNAPADRLPSMHATAAVSFSGATLIFLGAYGLLSLLYLGALIHLVQGSFLGRPLTVGEAYRRCLRRFGPLLGVNLCKMSILSVGLLLWFGPLALSLALRAWWLAAIWLIAGLLPWLALYLWLALVSIVLVIEERSVADSIRRSGQLMFVLTERGLLRSNGFRISVVLLVVSTLKFLLLMVSQAPYTAWKAFEVFRDPSLLGQYHRTFMDAAFDFLNMLLQTAVAPFGLATLVLFYFDIRIRKEGLDLTLRLRWLRDRLQTSATPKP